MRQEIIRRAARLFPFHALFVLRRGARRFFLAGCTARPTAAWVAQQARCLDNAMAERFFATHKAEITDDITNLTGTPGGDFRAWCERHIDAFR